MSRVLIVALVLMWLGVFIPLAAITAQSPVYVGCTPIPTFTPTLWANCAIVTASPTRPLAPIFQTATAAIAAPPIPTQEVFAPDPLASVTLTETKQGTSTAYVVVAPQGVNVRGDCRNTSSTCPPVGSVSYGSVIWVTETALDVYLWGKIGAGQWVALRSADGRSIFARVQP